MSELHSKGRDLTHAILRQWLRNRRASASKYSFSNDALIHWNEANVQCQCNPLLCSKNGGSANKTCAISTDHWSSITSNHWGSIASIAHCCRRDGGCDRCGHDRCCHDRCCLNSSCDRCSHDNFLQLHHRHLPHDLLNLHLWNRNY